MRPAARVGLRILKWAAIVGVAFAACVVVINLFDEQLSPNVAALAARSPPVPPQHNAYLALLGIDAPGVDPIDEGLRLVAEHEDEIARPMADRIRNFNAKYRTETATIAVRPARPRVPTCEAPAIPCLRLALAREPSVRAQLETSATAIERYLQAIQLPAFDDTATLDLYALFLPTQYVEPRRLLVLKAALDAQQGRRAEAVHFLLDDLRFWSSVLDRGSSLIVAILAARWVREDLAALSEMIGEPEIDVLPHAESIRGAIAPSPYLGRGFARTLAPEFQFSERYARMLEFDGSENVSLTDRLSNWAFLRAVEMNATRNRSATIYTVLQTAVEAMPSNCPDIARLPEQLHRFSEWDVGWLYNPLGKWVMSFGWHAYAEYPLRLCDVVAHMALVRAQLELRLANVPAGDVGIVLSRSDLANPHTGQPFDWADGARELSFTLMAPRPYQDAGPVRAGVPRLLP